MSEQAATSVIRVFVSSTFIDMQAERDFLVNRVFPDIRRQCADKGIDFEAIDLRWGVSGESNDAQVLAHCLDQIEGCVPYLFALIGGRYGWVPGEKPENAAVLEADERESSVTEIEIRRFENSVAQSGRQKRLLVALRSPELTQSLGVDQTREPAARARLEAMRGALARTDDAFEYADLDTLDVQVRAFFVAEADMLAKQLCTPARQIDARQNGYLNLLRIPGLGRLPLPLAFEAGEGERAPIDEEGLLAAFGRQRLQLLLGGPGSGKTSLCAALAQRWAEADGERRVLRLHIGATGELSLNGVLRDLYQLADAGAPEDWADGLVRALDAEARPTLIVLDGVERLIRWNEKQPSTAALIGHQPFQLLLTLHKLLGAQCEPFVLLACDPAVQADNALGTLLGVRTLEIDPYAPACAFGVTRIGPLDARLRSDFATQFFSFRGKHLNRDHVALIARAHHIVDLDTLYLACDRLRRFGELNPVKKEQDSFIAARIGDLFQQSREQAVAALVRELRSASGLDPAKVDAVLHLLAVSKYGLPATELIVLAASLSGHVVTLRDWAVIEGMLGPLLARSSTRMQFKNVDTLAQVLALLDAASLERARGALVEYLLAKVGAAGLHGVFSVTVDAVYPNELAWQLGALQGNQGWRHLLSPLGMVAWFVRDYEMSILEMSEAFEASAVEQAFAEAPDDMDELATIAQFRQASRDVLGCAVALTASRFERALEGSLLAMSGPEVALRGRAKRAVRTTNCALSAALQDGWPCPPNCHGAVISTIALLETVIDQDGAGSVRIAPLRALLADLLAAAAEYAQKENRSSYQADPMEVIECAVRGLEQKLGKVVGGV
ncbi:MAG: DUF4062 domain-containing protein [Pseudomonadota bacterium]